MKKIVHEIKQFWNTYLLLYYGDRELTYEFFNFSYSFFPFIYLFFLFRFGFFWNETKWKPSGLELTYACTAADARCKKSTYFTCATWKTIKRVLLFIKKHITRFALFSCCQHLKGQPQKLIFYIWYLSKNVINSIIRAITLERFHIVMQPRFQQKTVFMKLTTLLFEELKTNLRKNIKCFWKYIQNRLG